MPGINPETVNELPDPLILPGLIVQVPAGKPFSTILPVATVQVGWVIVPMRGAEGVTGWGLITAFCDAAETHPAALVTVKEYVPANRPVTVYELPDPMILPGLIVQVPEGRPFRTTLPVATVQVGCVIVPMTGADGVTGCGLITAFCDAAETQPAALVTVKE